MKERNKQCQMCKNMIYEYYDKANFSCKECTLDMLEGQVKDLREENNIFESKMSMLHGLIGDRKKCGYNTLVINEVETIIGI